MMTLLRRVWPWGRRQPSAFSLPPNVEIGTGEPIDPEEAKRIFAEAERQPIRECMPPVGRRHEE
jgi:hypothetical protein